MTSLLFINPPLKVNIDDTYTTGIVYMPFILAEAVGITKFRNISVKVLDMFAEGARSGKCISGSIIVGKDLTWLNQKVEDFIEGAHVVVFANQIINHKLIKEICESCKNNKKILSVSVLENAEAVTSYSLKKVANEFYSIGCNDLITGDIEDSFNDFLNNKFGQIIKSPRLFLGKKEFNKKNNESNRIFPAWEEFPLHNYWSLGFSHGPITKDKYLPILTSKGCPFPCEFCVMPELSGRNWRSKPFKKIFEEMVYFFHKFGVSEFHIEDTNPTIKSEKFVNLAKLISKSEFKNRFIWKFISGTKVETFKSFLDLKEMRAGGLDYVSFSPESGSLKIRKKIGKSFNIKHSIDFIRWSKKLHIKTQACFVLGFPEENISDILKTLVLIARYTFFGIDEIAIFIITPIPGSKLFNNVAFSNINGNDNFSFSPTWRSDFRFLYISRILLYVIFLTLKAVFHPFNLLKNIFKIFSLSKSQNLKMESAPIRSIFYKSLIKESQ